MIKAIETRYAGCRFRSRLEARWAVFLDTLKIEWQYEYEGFETSAGWYLPDFRIDPSCIEHSDGTAGQWDRPTSGEVYLEVKGAPLRLDEAERLRSFACDPGEPRFLLALGQIPTPEEEIHCLKGWGMGGATRGQIGTGKLRMEYPYQSHDRWGPTQPKMMDYAFDMSSVMRDPWIATRPVGIAVNAARSARFEHGERG